MPEIAIADTSALIALDKIGLLDILCKIYAQIVLPDAVLREFGSPGIDCYVTKKVESQLIRLLVGDLNLGKGESEVIALASESGMKTIIDDEKARKVAKTLGLNVTGTIGVLLKAEESGFIESAYAKTKELKDKGFYVSDELLNKISRFRKKP
jgi:uncharacterized protein